MAVFMSVLRCARIQSSIISSQKPLLGSLPSLCISHDTTSRSQLVRRLSSLTLSGDPRLPLIPQTLDPVTVRNFADLKIKDDIEICPITSLEDNKRLAEMNLSQSESVSIAS